MSKWADIMTGDNHSAALTARVALQASLVAEFMVMGGDVRPTFPTDGDIARARKAMEELAGTTPETAAFLRIVAEQAFITRMEFYCEAEREEGREINPPDIGEPVGQA